MDCCCFCPGLRSVGTGYATRADPAAGRVGHCSSRSVRRRYAPHKWCLCHHSRPPCRPQVRGRSNLLATQHSTGVKQATVRMIETSGRHQSAGRTARTRGHALIASILSRASPLTVAIVRVRHVLDRAPAKRADTLVVLAQQKSVIRLPRRRQQVTVSRALPGKVM